MADFTTANEFPVDSDLNLGIINIRVDSTTSSVQISTTSVSIDIIYTVKLCDPSSHSFSAASSSGTGISTTPVSFYNSVINSVGKFVEIQVLNLTYLTTYLITVACISSEPEYALTIAKLY
jgi:hypothetical protein